MDDRLNRSVSANTDVDYHVDVVSGSRVSDIVIVSSARASQDGVDFRRVSGRVHLDWDNAVRCRVDGELGRQIGDTFDNDCVEAVLPPDEAALQKAEEAGSLWPVLEGTRVSLSCLAERMGAGGNQPHGLALALINRSPLELKLTRIFLEARSHARQDERVLEDLKEVTIRVPVSVWFTTPGGMGAGAMPAFIWEDGIIRSCAQKTGVQPSIAVQVICRGSLEVKDAEKASLNESVALRYLQVVASGGYVSPLTGRIHPPLTRSGWRRMRTTVVSLPVSISSSCSVDIAIIFCTTPRPVPVCAQRWSISWMRRRTSTEIRGPV